MCWRRLVQYLLVCARLGQEGEQIHRYSHTHMHTNNSKKRDNRKVLKLANLAVNWRQTYRNQHFSYNHTLACLQETRRLSETPCTDGQSLAHKQTTISFKLALLYRPSLPHLSLHPILYARPIITAAYQNSGFFLLFLFQWLQFIGYNKSIYLANVVECATLSMLQRLPLFNVRPFTPLVNAAGPHLASRQ